MTAPSHPGCPADQVRWATPNLVGEGGLGALGALACRGAAHT
jgi:hypothetical protein